MMVWRQSGRSAQLEKRVSVSSAAMSEPHLPKVGLCSLLSDLLSGCYDIIIFDVDCKNTSSGMSSPPPAFVEREMLTNTRELLSKDGKYKVLDCFVLQCNLPPLFCSFLLPSSSALSPPPISLCSFPLFFPTPAHSSSPLSCSLPPPFNG